MSGSPIPRLITSTPAARLAAILRSSSANRYGGMRSRRSLGCMQLLEEFGAERRPIDGHGPAGEGQIQVLVELDEELAAVEAHGHRGATAAPDVRDRGPARAGARRQRLADPPLEDA